MSLKQIVPPAVEPVELEEAKDHLRVTEDDDDSYISGLISMARGVVEIMCQRALIEQQYRYSCDSFPSSRVIKLERPPLISVESVKYLNTSGVLTTFPDTQYSIDTDSEPGRVVLKDGYSWPSTASEPNCVRIEYTCGYGDDASAVPKELIQAMYLLIGTFYANRENVVVAPNIEAMALPGAFEMLVFPHLATVS